MFGHCSRECMGFQLTHPLSGLLGKGSRPRSGRMAFVVKEDKVLHPSKVGQLGSDTVVADANGIAGLFEEFRHGEVVPNSR